MLCVKLKDNKRTCTGVSGGISNAVLFDPADFNFTQTTPDDGYSAIALREGATAAGGAKMFDFQFQINEAERKVKVSRKGPSVKYEHELSLQVPQLSQDRTTFFQMLDAGSTCCGVGMILRHNDGKIFVIGERFVNDEEITKFLLQHDGSDGGSGKQFDDFNGMNVVLKANYTRELVEFTGAWSAITALM
ncbi:hypothetical protein ACE38W_00460 [Chitinophaga sp. Hz27]|uniref:hypothetical protein n=1 Tax=Chitinophaga sp. Hz27 TaxID=3347169 RepID=UPI0035D9A0A3